MSGGADLVVAPCDAAAARYAVLNWHYSKAMPIGKLVRFGVWESGKFIGCVLFGRGASPELGASFGASQEESCELVRVALREHETPVTQIVARSLRLLKQSNSGLRLVVSFADTNQGHHGGIYQAGNWIYTGVTPSSTEVLFEGRWIHTRMLRQSGWGTATQASKLSDEAKAALPRRKRVGKHRYVMPLDRAMRKRVELLAKPYPDPITPRSKSRR